MRSTTLSNGLTIMSEKNETSKVCTISYLIKSGSYDEGKDETGIAHLIEHMLFKGTINRDYKSINNEIESIGGYLNAETNFLYTKYYCTIPYTEWKKGLDVLTDMIFNHTIPEEEFIKEKKVVQEELKMYNDDPQSFVCDELIKQMFTNYPNRQSIGGTVQDIEKLTRNDLIDFINRNYFPQNMIVIATGNIEHENIVSFVEDYINSLNIMFTECQKTYEQFKFENLNNKIVEFERKEIEQAHLMFGSFGPSYNSNEMLPMQLLSIILGGNSSSVLFDTIREQKGLAYSINYDIEPMDDVSIAMGYAGLNRDSNVIDEILKIFANIESYLTEEKLKASKAYFIGMLYLRMEKTSGINNHIAENLLHNDDTTIDELVTKVNNITLQDVINVAKKYLTKDNTCFIKLN